MYNLKRPPVPFRDKVLSEFEENYMLAKPDILVHDLEPTDDLLVFGNNSFFSYFPPAQTVIHIRTF